MAKHPIQPLERDHRGVIRFKSNAIVRHLLDHGGITLNDIARLDFSREDREQFAQLIGYSHSGSSDLSYVSDEVWDAAEMTFSTGVTEQEARLHVLRTRLETVQQYIREAAVALFSVHPDDLQSR